MFFYCTVFTVNCYKDLVSGFHMQLKCVHVYVAACVFSFILILLLFSLPSEFSLWGFYSFIKSAWVLTTLVFLFDIRHQTCKLVFACMVIYACCTDTMNTISTS